jgi:hypothetical protein
MSPALIFSGETLEDDICGASSSMDFRGNKLLVGLVCSLSFSPRDPARRSRVGGRNVPEPSSPPLLPGLRKLNFEKMLPEIVLRCPELVLFVGDALEVEGRVGSVGEVGADGELHGKRIASIGCTTSCRSAVKEAVEMSGMAPETVFPRLRLD